MSVNIRGNFILVLLLLGAANCVYGQRSFSGDLSIKYPSTRVTSIGAVNQNWVRVSDLAGFAPGDTIMILQMQGVGISTAQGLYGQVVQNTFGTPGRWEFHKIQSINAGSKEIGLSSLITIDFKAGSNVQVIKVPFCNRGIISGNLIANGWDPVKKSGGVMAIIAARDMVIASDIDMKGRGFAGGRDTTGLGICSEGLPEYNFDSYPLADNKTGKKGEGIAIHDIFNTLLYPVHARGQGPNLTGGGGGNGRYTGGGGGSNRGRGGLGGQESSLLCNFLHFGGYGGKALTAGFFPGKIFMGGGGGASTSASGTSSVAGNGNGGGIIFILADTLIGAGGKIIADGAAGYNGNSTGGAGGGGAGGSIILTARHNSGSMIEYRVAGGKGGDNPGNDFGAGGGGGGGLIWVQNNIAGAYKAVVTAGINGLSLGGETDTATVGRKQNDAIDPNLKGFLFNSIWSSRNGLRRDTVCAETPIPKLVGTTPIGGTGPYLFQWQRSNNLGSTWTNLVSTIDCTPPVETGAGTYLYRRVVTDNSAPVINDVGIPDTIVVQPKITGNAINISADVICYNQTPNTLFSVGNPVVPVIGDTTYTWVRWTNGGTDRDTIDNEIFRYYIPSEKLIANTNYMRVVESGKCIDSSALKFVTVLPLIANNELLAADEEKCNGTPFTNLTATMPGTLSGGNGAYTYKWINSPDGTDNWSQSAGSPLIGTNYDPVEAQFTPYPKVLHFKRVVYSGPLNVCKDTSLTTTILTMWAPISGNTISGDTTICKNSPAQIRKGMTALTGGSGVYAYLWERSTNSGTNWTTSGTAASFDPGILPGPVWYRRTVYSGQANACTNVSVPSRVNVFRSPTGEIVTVTDTVICSGTPARLGVVLTGQAPFTVEFRDNVNALNTIKSGLLLSDTVIFRPRSTAASTVFRYEIAAITDGRTCRDSLRIGSRNVNTYRYPVANPGPRDSICGLIYTFKAVPSASTASFWRNLPAGLTLTSLTLPNPVATVNAAAIPGKREDFTLMWYEENGNKACADSQNVTITFAKEPLPVVAGPGKGTSDAPFYTFDYVDYVQADTPLVATNAFWADTYPSTLELDYDAAIGAFRVANMTEGENLMTWKVENGICSNDPRFEVEVKYFVSGLVVPQAFSPNSDDINDTFIIKGLLTEPGASRVTLKIMNSAGAQVYSTTNDGAAWKDWDGKNNRGEDVPEGTYYYLLEINSNRDGGLDPKPKSGFVIVKRSYFE